MSLEPSKFFVGVVDFFAILLPGGLLTYAIRRYLGSGGITGKEEWMVFLFGSYLLGHFIFLFGSAFLDDHVYDKVRRATYKSQVKRLAMGKPLAAKWTRWLTRTLFKSMGLD